MCTPKIIDTGIEFYPPRRQFDKVSKKFDGILDENQIKGIEQILTKVTKDPSARVLISDGPGVGKTMQLLALAWAQAKRMEEPALVVTKNQLLLDSMREEAKTNSIGSKRVHFTSYEHLQHTLECNKYATILFDEAHVLAEHQILPELQAGFKNTTVILASATAFSSPANFSTILSILEKESSEQASKRAEMIVIGDEYFPLDNWGTVAKGIANTKHELMEEGRCVQRHLVFDGQAEWMGKENSSDRQVMLSELTQLIQGEIQEGRKVVLYSKHKQWLEKKLEAFNPSDFKKFRSGKSNLIILDPTENAEGLRLHDRSGKHPRTIIIDEPQDISDLIQIQGRVHRRNSQSTSKLIAIYDPNNAEHLEKLEATRNQAEFLIEQREVCPALGKELLEMELAYEAEMDR